MSTSSQGSPAEPGRKLSLPSSERPGRLSLSGLRYRKLRAADSDAYLNHLLRLDPSSRQMRFGAMVSDDAIRAFAAGAFGPGAIFIGCFSDADLIGVAELYLIPTPTLAMPWRKEAELALSVESDWRGRGIGTALFRRAVDAARNRWCETVHMSCLQDNPGMRQIAEHGHVKIEIRGRDVEGVLPAAWPTPLSVLLEYFDDAAALTAAARG